METLKNKSENLNWILTTDYLYDIKIIHTLHQCFFNTREYKQAYHCCFVYNNINMEKLLIRFNNIKRW